MKGRKKVSRYGKVQVGLVALAFTRERERDRQTDRETLEVYIVLY